MGINVIGNMVRWYRRLREEGRTRGGDVIRVRVSEADRHRMRILMAMSGESMSDILLCGMYELFERQTGCKLVSYCGMGRCRERSYLRLGGDFERRELNYYMECDAGHITSAAELRRAVMGALHERGLSVDPSKGLRE